MGFVELDWTTLLIIRNLPRCVKYDLAIVGSSFAGSLLAVLARRSGKSVVLLERGRHPRFVIGESSTPLTNLLLEELSDRYQLPWLRPFSKWGTWQRTYPQIPCGLKRGFSFFFHQRDQVWTPRSDRDNELMVAASPNDTISDTHWYRPDFDAHFVAEAQRAGVDYVDSIMLLPPLGGAGAWDLRGERPSGSRRFQADYLVDASGPRGYLARAWALPEVDTFTSADQEGPTQALFSHFRGVGKWSEIHRRESETPPFSPDDAALHHVFPGGWIWVLRFNNGITSAGCAVTRKKAEELQLAEGAPAWERLLAQFPTIKQHFRSSIPVREFTHMPRLSYRAGQVTGPGWCLLPGAAGFIDPLLSTGFVLNLLGLERLADVWSRGETPNDENYGSDVAEDLAITAKLVRCLYRTMNRPSNFRALGSLYFAAASFSETARRLKRPELAAGFLLRKQSEFAAGFSECLMAMDGARAADLSARTQKAIAPYDVAGFTAVGKRNWYGCHAADLYAAAPRLGVGSDEIDAMLKRVGFVEESG